MDQSDTAAQIGNQVAFLAEIDRLKEVVRASPLISMSRRENSAEHSWHLAMYALTLKDHAVEPVDIARVVQMMLLHDIVEIDAGDAPIHGSYDKAAQEAAELAAADRIFALLPGKQGKAMRALWDEFEAAETPDARFAKALDRMQPVVQNLYSGGGTWNDFHVTHEQFLTRVAPVIEAGAPGLWAYLEPRVAAYFEGAEEG